MLVVLANSWWKVRTIAIASTARTLKLHLQLQLESVTNLSVKVRQRHISGL
jgi:hypothetical protein